MSTSGPLSGSNKKATDEWLGKLASVYKMPKAQVIKRLLHQAIADRLDDKDGRGEVLALSKY